MPFRQKNSRAELTGWLAIRKLLVAGIVLFYVSLALPASRRALYLVPLHVRPYGGVAFVGITHFRKSRKGKGVV